MKARGAWVMLAVMVAVGGWEVPAFGAGPVVVASVQKADVGDSVAVRLSGWSPGVVTVTVCGDGAREGSADCAVSAASSVAVPAQGVAQLQWRVAKPPVGCPCVIRAVSATGDQVATTPLDLPEVADSATVDGGVGVRLEIPSVRIVSRWSLAELLGGTARRTLQITVRNDGPDALTQGDLTLDLGRAAGASAPKAVPVGGLAAGASRSLDVPFTIAAPAFGRYRVTGQITDADFSARTNSWPWLLPLTPFLLALLWRARLLLRPATPLRVGGIALIGGGLACAIVLAGQTVLPGTETASAQKSLDGVLAQQWAAPGGPTVTSLDAQAAAPVEGQPLAVITVPRWRAHYTVVEGVTTADLRLGPGHYPGTALPGQVGNVGIAGHRGPPGLPFNDIDQLQPGDPIILETATAYYVYKVQRHVIVTPDHVEVIAPVPQQPGATPSKAMLTMTACHPRYANKQRYVVFSELDRTYSKALGQRPPELG